MFCRKPGFLPRLFVLLAAGGKQVFKRERLLPLSKLHPSLVLIVPTNKLPDGDYILALKGVTQAGETEDVSKFLFRVERKVTAH
jgi:hypothetical protein